LLIKSRFPSNAF